jgi:GTP cyclohydrolase IA
MQEKNLSQVLREQMRSRGRRFWANDNVSEYMSDAVKEKLIAEATVAFEGVLDALLIDRETDPNSRGTARRLAKMYFNEVMAGRYEPAPDCTAFPNDSADRYEGMLVVRSELRSMCSHHHQPVTGVAYIGIIAANKLIGVLILPMRSWPQLNHEMLACTYRPHTAAVKIAVSWHTQV